MSAERDDNVDARAEARRKAEVMLAFADGAEVEYTITWIERWMKDTTPIWDWNAFNYRVKPKPRELWVVIDRDGDLSMSFQGGEALKQANEYAVGANRGGTYAPYTVVHMCEVTP